MAEPEAPKLSKQQMFEAEMLNAQLERLQEYLQQLEKQHAEVLSMKEALEQFKTIKGGDEVLTPLAAGVFMHTKATGSHELLVNVGNGVIVPKSVEGVHQMIDEQIAEMRRYEDDLHRQFNESLAKLQEIERQAR